MNESIHKRPLVTPDEVGRFFGNQDNPMSLILLSGNQPLALKRISYYGFRGLRGTYDPHPDHARPLTLIQLEHQLGHEEKQRVQRAREKEQQRQAQALARKEAEAQAQKLADEAERKRRQYERQRMDEQNEIARRFYRREAALHFVIKASICALPIPIFGIVYGGIAAIGLAAGLWWIAQDGWF